VQDSGLLRSSYFTFSALVPGHRDAASRISGEVYRPAAPEKFFGQNVADDFALTKVIGNRLNVPLTGGQNLGPTCSDNKFPRPIASLFESRLGRERNIGFVATVSARALNVASFISLSGFDHHDGIRPQRIRSTRRLPSWSSIVSIVVVGQTLKRARVFTGT
jgi:hypothetical protein